MNWVEPAQRESDMVNVHQTSPAPYFTGKFPHKVEGKNRVTIPADWRFGEEVELYMFSRTNKRCIGVFTRAELERVQEVATADLTAVERANFLDEFGSKLTRVLMDKGGRISLPPDLQAEHGIGKEVVFVGSVKTFNIWNPAHYESANAASASANGGTGNNVMAQLGL